MVKVSKEVYLLCRELERLEEDLNFTVFYSFAEFWAERNNCKKKYERMLPKEDK